MKRQQLSGERETRFTPSEYWSSTARGGSWILQRDGTRDAAETDTATIQGYSSVFNRWYTVRDFFGEYKERVDPGTFGKTLKESGLAVIGLFNHDLNIPLGTIAAGTMRQGTDKIGLWYEIDAALDSPQSKSVVVAVDRGDVAGSSITFRVIRDIWEEEHDADGALISEKRTIVEAQLFEHGPVTTPASPTTTAEVNSKITDAEVKSVRIKLRRGSPLTEWDRRIFNQHGDYFADTEPSTGRHSEPLEPPTEPHQTASTDEDIRRYEWHFMSRFDQVEKELQR